MIYRLYLDETGTPDVKNINPNFPHFIFSGFIVDESQAPKLKTRADQVKFKYWSRTNVVFHSREIGRRENDFSILKDPSVEQNFHKDLLQLIISTGGSSVVVIVDKNKAKALGWSASDIYRNTSRAMLAFFIEFLHAKNNKGQIIVESAGTKRDLLFYGEYIYLLANGSPSLGLTHQKMKQLLTSISFVSKNNHDIEEQIADLLAYPAAHNCLVASGSRTTIPNSYEDKMCRVLNTKILRFSNKKAGTSCEGFLILTP